MSIGDSVSSILVLEIGKERFSPRGRGELEGGLASYVG